MVTPHLPWKFHANRSSRFLVMLLEKKQRKKSPENNTRGNERSLHTPPQHNGVATIPYQILMPENLACPRPVCCGSVSYNINSLLARDMTYDRQHLLWQKQVTVIGSVDLDSQIDEYHTGVAQLRHVVCHRVGLCEDGVLLRCCRSLLQQSVILLIFRWLW